MKLTCQLFDWGNKRHHRLIRSKPQIKESCHKEVHIFDCYLGVLSLNPGPHLKGCGASLKWDLLFSFDCRVNVRSSVYVLLLPGINLGCIFNRPVLVQALEKIFVPICDMSFLFTLPHKWHVYWWILYHQPKWKRSLTTLWFFLLFLTNLVEFQLWTWMWNFSVFPPWLEISHLTVVGGISTLHLIFLLFLTSLVESHLCIWFHHDKTVTLFQASLVWETEKKNCYCHGLLMNVTVSLWCSFTSSLLFMHSVLFQGQFWFLPLWALSLSRRPLESVDFSQETSRSRISKKGNLSRQILQCDRRPLPLSWPFSVCLFVYNLLVKHTLKKKCYSFAVSRAGPITC